MLIFVLEVRKGVSQRVGVVCVVMAAGPSLCGFLKLNINRLLKRCQTRGGGDTLITAGDRQLMAEREERANSLIQW